MSNTVVMVEHDMRIVAASDRVIDVEPGAGCEGGRIVEVGKPNAVAQSSRGTTATYLADAMRWCSAACYLSKGA
jgi:excinuclease ABC subunit A